MSSPFHSPIDLFTFYALKWVGTPYHWGEEHGGDDFAGMDCSGFVCECLRAVGLVPHKWRMSAQGIYDHFVKAADMVLENYVPQTRDHAAMVERCFPTFPIRGAIQFHENNTHQIYHCNICIGDGMVVGAIGGDKTTVDDATAADANAFVQVRPFNYAPEFTRRKYLYINPFVITHKEVFNGCS